MNGATDLSVLRKRLAELDAERLALLRRLQGQETAAVAPVGWDNTKPDVTLHSSEEEKIALFRRLFAGRQDVFPLRWESAKTGRSGYSFACANEWKPGICGKPQLKCGECLNRSFIPLSDRVIDSHLRGKDAVRGRESGFVAGVYPLLEDQRCWFLAADFDGETWRLDALAFLETCCAAKVPAALERSRSGDGGHVWIFFSEAVPAREARLLGACLLTQTLERRPEVGFKSYDRLFPSQDTLPKGGFGNLIALPLQQPARDYGNSVFVDEQLRPYADQWAFLSSLERLTPQTMSGLITDAQARGLVTGVRMPVDDDEGDEPWRLPPSRERAPELVSDPLPRRVRVVYADGVYIDRSALPQAMVARLIRLAAFQNPAFYRAQAMRRSTHEISRIVSCAKLHRLQVELPRGCLDEALALLRSHGVKSEVEDAREAGASVECRFLGTLREEQERAVETLGREDCGVLAATTAFGKTIVAAALMARRGCSTLILVHRKELLDQWVARLKQFLSVEAQDIGRIGGGRRRATGKIDVALIQSLVRKGKVSDAIAGYGQLIVDECHHLSAVSFEAVAQRSKARYVLGLSATVTRKDGQHPIIFMQCGPVRYRVNAKAQAAQRSFTHRVCVRETEFRMPAEMTEKEIQISALYTALARDEARNALIVEDVREALAAGRTPLVLTERREHLETLQARFAPFVRSLVTLSGGMKVTDRRAAQEVLDAGGVGERLLLATGRYLGEGFDDARLDTLFLAMPISWQGTLAQYVGRLHREFAGKREVVVYDYVDAQVAMLARMAGKREKGYRALGYVLESVAAGR